MSEFIFIDLETTGLDDKKEKIIEIGAVKVDSQLNKIGEYHTLVNPLKHGLDDEMVKNAPTIDKVEADLLAFIGDRPLIAHNSNFEKAFLTSELKSKLKNQFMDSMEMIALFFPTAESLKLDTIIRQLQIRETENHRALDDAEDLYKVLLYMKEQFKKDAAWNLVAQRLLSYFSVSEWPWADLVTGIMPDHSPKYVPTAKNGNGVKEQNRPGELKLTQFKVDAEHLYSLVHAPLEKRAGQKIYMEEICDSLNNDKSAMIEAGTGIGKTLAYLLPSVNWAISNSSQVLISTKTKMLQNQIMEKDIPLAKQLLGLKNLNAVKVQGRNNYLCVRKMDRFFSDIDLTDDLEGKFAKLFFFALDKLADLADFTKIHPWTLKNYPTIKRSLGILCAESSNCMQSRCEYYEDCHYFRMVRAARRADLLVVNHSLILNWPSHLPKGEKIIFDEAHNLNSEATSATSVVLDSAVLSSLSFIIHDDEKNRGVTTELKKMDMDPDLVEKIEALSRRLKLFEAQITDLYKKLFYTVCTLAKKRISSEYPERFILYSPTMIYGQYGLAKTKEWHDCALCFADLLGTMDEAEIVLKDIMVRIEDKEYAMIVESVVERVSEYRTLLQKTVAISSSDLMDSDNVLWISWSEKNLYWELGKAFVDVGGILAEKVYPNYSSCIFTSATLRAGKDRLNGKILSDEVVVIPSPFDYKNHSRVFFLSDAFHPNQDEARFMSQLVGIVSNVVEMLGGRTLVLFSSIKRMNQCHEALVKQLAPKGFTVLKNNMGGDVVAYFMNQERAVLLGSETFGEGLDIKGDKVSCVILERLPVIQPSPIHNARGDIYRNNTGKNPMDGFDLPYRLLKLRQWSGRLIRGMEDKGTVVVCDKWYATQKKEIQNSVKEALDPMPVELAPSNELSLRIRNCYKDWGYKV
jgi:DNA polymerase III epsilon subunit family exonuclease